MANYIVLEMDLNEKWWDKWFVVAGLSIDRSIKLHHYNYFSMSSMYLLTLGDIAKKEFFVRKPWRNLKGFWSKLDIIGVVDNFGGLLSEVCKFCFRRRFSKRTEYICIFSIGYSWKKWTDGEIPKRKSFPVSNVKWCSVYRLINLNKFLMLSLICFMSEVLRYST